MNEQEGTERFDERATLLEMERVMRTFREKYFAPILSNDEWQFHPGTVRMMEAVSALLDHLDEGRKAKEATGKSAA